MTKRFKIWFHSDSDSDIHELSIPKSLIFFGSCLLIFIITGITWVGFDYVKLKKLSLDTLAMEDAIVTQKDTISNQNKQIQQFATHIELLKNQVRNLAKLEKRVRLIADIEKTNNGLIGIGGIPENNLDQELPLESKHNGLIREMHQQISQTTAAADQQVLDFDNLIQQLEKKKNLLAATPSIRPVDGWITSRFGYRKSPFTGKRSFHSGLDIANRSGTKIIATADGRISYAARKMYIGKLVVIDHGYGKQTKYGHLKKILVKVGQKVKRGDVIALLGNTGQSTGPHLHYEVRIHGTPVNPTKYILN